MPLMNNYIHLKKIYILIFFSKVCNGSLNSEFAGPWRMRRAWELKMFGGLLVVH